MLLKSANGVTFASALALTVGKRTVVPSRVWKGIVRQICSKAFLRDLRTIMVTAMEILKEG